MKKKKDDDASIFEKKYPELFRKLRYNAMQMNKKRIAKNQILMKKKRLYKVPNLEIPVELIDPKKIKKVLKNNSVRYAQLGNGRIVKNDEKD
tara:strand:- start:15 stop:290 length:276 start_codon:yes stop_codon:yes gene_type:complete